MPAQHSRYFQSHLQPFTADLGFRMANASLSPLNACCHPPHETAAMRASVLLGFSIGEAGGEAKGRVQGTASERTKNRVRGLVEAQGCWEPIDALEFQEGGPCFWQRYAA